MTRWLVHEIPDNAEGIAKAREFLREGAGFKEADLDDLPLEGGEA